MPRELVALPHVESSFNPRAYSHVGAAGLWQFMRSTGRIYLRVDDVVDERMDPHKASVAAARLLGSNYRQIDSWPLAITAYNHGLAGMARAVRTLGTRGHRDDRLALSEPQLRLRVAELLRRVSRRFRDRPRPRPVLRPAGAAAPARARGREARTTTTRSTACSVRSASISTTLREHNLALRAPVWSGAKYVPRGYELRVPQAERGRKPVDQLLASIAASERLAEQHRGPLLQGPSRRHPFEDRAAPADLHARALGAEQPAQPQHDPRGPGAEAARPRERERAHRGRARRADADRSHPPGFDAGDTLTNIAQRYGVREAEIVAANRLTSRHVIGIGQRLRLPGPAEPLPAPAPVVVAAQAEAALDAALPRPAGTPVIAPGQTTRDRAVRSRDAPGVGIQRGAHDRTRARPALRRDCGAPGDTRARAS